MHLLLLRKLCERNSSKQGENFEVAKRGECMIHDNYIALASFAHSQRMKFTDLLLVSLLWDLFFQSLMLVTALNPVSYD